MNNIAFWVLVAIAIFFTALFAGDGIYVGLFAGEMELSEYPWGTELGWSYINKENYMFSGIGKAAITWIPVFLFIAIKHLTNAGRRR